jgi:hypothetical protein
MIGGVFQKAGENSVGIALDGNKPPIADQSVRVVAERGGADRNFKRPADRSG